ncbi:MAG: hypothetical protein AAF647_12615 [Pseudomonadota bacterium]
MYRSFAALVLSGVLAVTSLSPTQAHADNRENLAKFLVGAIVLYGIADAVNDNKRKSPSVTRHAPKTVYHHTHRPAPKKKHAAPARRKHLPAGCVLTHRQHYGEKRTVFGNRCLKNNYRHYASLPNQCFRRFDTVKGVRVGWGRPCLRRAGYSW